MANEVMSDAMAGVEEALKRMPAKKMMPSVTLDADTLIKNLSEQRSRVNALFDELIASARKYKNECEAFMVHVRDVMHENV